MLLTLLLFVLVSPHPTPSPSASPAAGSARSDDPKKDDAEFEKRRNEAGDDIAKLWKLHEWCKQAGRDKDSKATLRKIVKLDPAHKDANLALGNVYFDGKWFANDKKIEEYKKEREAKAKADEGLVEWKGQWVRADDVPYLEKGLVKDAEGHWIDPELSKKLAEGWVRDPDEQWIPPSEKDNLGKGLWKCGDRWLSLDDANKYHAEIGQWWRVPYERFTIYSTCDRQVIADRIQYELVRAIADLDHVYGAKLTQKPIVIVLRDQQQYSNYAAPDEGDGRMDTDRLGCSTVHYARPAELGYDEETFEQLATGVGYWDASSESGNRFGACAARHALGQAIGEMLDPSPKTLEKRRKQGEKFDMRTFGKAHWEEKRVPMWLRFGTSTYAERYYIDPKPGLAADPNWARKWSVQSIATKGGLRSLKQIFEFNLNPGDPDDAAKLINETGLLVSFCVDGNHKGVSEKWKAVRDAIVTGKDKKSVTTAVTALQTELDKSVTDLRKFAGL